MTRLTLAGAFAVLAAMAVADERIWTGGGVNAFASNPTNWVSTNAPGEGDSIVLDSRTNKNMTWDLNLAVQSWAQVGYAGTVTVATVYPGKGAFTNFTILGDCVISNGMWTHTGNSNSEVNRLRVTIGGNLFLGPAGRIDVAKKGYAAQYGPGCPPSGTGGSASHGGLGTVDSTAGSRPGVCYGSVVAPSRLGSGSFNNAAYAGAGAIWLDVTGQAQVDGTLYATSATESGARPGAGGSIYLVAGALWGGGSIQANGGGGYNGGGGGRIALAVTNAGEDFSLFTGQITAYTEAATTGRGGAGTIYLRKAGQGLHEGTLIVDNAGQAGKATEISSNVTEAAVGTVILRNRGNLVLQTNQTLTVGGSWSNAATFTALTGSEVVFAGAAGSTAVVYGSSTFVGLICTNGGGQTLLFQAGQTNTLAALGRLRLKGNETATNLALRSTADGVPWRFNVAGSTDQAVSFVDVKDSDALTGGGAEVSAINSLDHGGNSNWVFLTVGGCETNVWTGAGNTVWSQKGNWSLDRVPTETDFIRIPSAMPRYPALDDNRSVSGMEIQSGASLDLAGFNLQVTGDATVAGALRASGTETITFQEDVDFTGGSFRERQSAVVLAGSGAQNVDLANLSFCWLDVLTSAGAVTFTDGFTARRLRCEAADGTRSLTFQAGAAFILRDLVLLGSVATTNITLLSSSTGNPWHLAVSGYRSVRGVDVRDSDANGGLPITASSCKNSGNNDNWIFGAVSKEWTPTSGNDFHTSANWTPEGVPNESTRIRIQTGPSMTMTGAVTILDLVVGGGAGVVTGMINGSLTVLESAVVLSNGVLEWNKPGMVGEDWVVAEGGLLTHAVNISTEANKIDLTIGGHAWVDRNGLVDVVGKGYSSGNGPGIYFGGYGGGSASYGGVGPRITSPAISANSACAMGPSRRRPIWEAAASRTIPGRAVAPFVCRWPAARSWTV